MKPLTLVAARRWWPLALGVLLGAIAGLLVSLLGSGVRRAEASVLISSPAGPAAVTPMLPNLRELAKSGVVAGNVQSTLRLTKSTRGLRRQLHATVRPQSEVIAISATDEHADYARQIAQEAAVVFAQLVDTRFGTAKPALHAAVLDSAHVLGGPDRHLSRNALVGALVGLLLGSAGVFLLASGARPVVAAGGDDDRLRKRESVLEQRVKGVTARERAVAVQAGKLAAREQELEARAAKVTATGRRPPASSSRRRPRAKTGEPRPPCQVKPLPPAPTARPTQRPPNRRPKPGRPCLLRPEPGISTSYKTPWTPRRASRRSRQRSGGPISTSSASMRRPTARYRVPSIR